MQNMFWLDAILRYDVCSDDYCQNMQQAANLEVKLKPN